MNDNMRGNFILTYYMIMTRHRIWKRQGCIIYTRKVSAKRL